MADACLFVMNLPEDVFRRELLSYPKPCFVNVGTGEELTIRELAELVASAVGYLGKIVFDSTMPEGTPKKLLNIEILSDRGWKSKTEIAYGIHKFYQWFI